jgi:hypothetical protein
MDGVAELIANNGVFAADEEKPPKPRRSMVKRGALLGATLMFIVSLLTMLAGFGDPLRHHVGKVLAANFSIWLALMAIIGVSGYLKRLIANFFNIVSNVFTEEETSPSKQSASSRGPVLPAAYSAPVADSGRQFVDTTKMGQQSSITEQTTSRLNKV